MQTTKTQMTNRKTKTQIKGPNIKSTVILSAPLKLGIYVSHSQLGL